MLHKRCPGHNAAHMLPHTLQVYKTGYGQAYGHPEASSLRHSLGSKSSGSKASCLPGLSVAAVSSCTAPGSSPPAAADIPAAPLVVLGPIGRRDSQSCVYHLPVQQQNQQQLLRTSLGSQEVNSDHVPSSDPAFGHEQHKWLQAAQLRSTAAAVAAAHFQQHSHATALPGAAHAPTVSASNGGSDVQHRRVSNCSPQQHEPELLIRHITRCIKLCSSWQEVDVLVQEYGPAFNIIHVSAAITHLAQLSQRQVHADAPAGLSRMQVSAVDMADADQQHGNQQHVQGLGLITSQMALQHQQLQLHLHAHRQQQQRQQEGLAQSLQQQQESAPWLPLQQQHQQQQHVIAPHLQGNSGCDKHEAVQQQQQELLLTRLLQQAVSLLEQAEARQVANMLWALSVLLCPWQCSREPVATCITVLTKHAVTRFGSAEAQHLSNMALAVAKLKLPVGQCWTQQLLHAWLNLVQHKQRAKASNSSIRSSSSWSGSSSSGSLSIGTIRGHSSSNGYRSSNSAWAKQHSSSIQGREQSSRAAEQGSSSTNGFNSRSSNWAAGAAEKAAPLASTSGVNPQATCNLLWALVQLQHQPTEAWLQEVMAAAAPELVIWPAKSVALLLWGCGRLGYQVVPPVQHKQAVTQQQQQQHLGMDHEGEQQVHSILAQQHEAAVKAADNRDSSTAGQLGIIASSGGAVSSPPAKLQHQQQLEMQQLVQAALLHHAHAFSSQDLSQALWGAASMGLQIPQDILQHLLEAGSMKLADAPSQQQWQQQSGQQQQQVQSQLTGIQGSAQACSSSSTKPGNGRQQQMAQAEIAHSASLLLWSLTRLTTGTTRQQLPAYALRAWLVALTANTAAAQCQSLAVAAWALCKLGLAATCPGVVLGLLQSAAGQLHQQQLLPQLLQQHKAPGSMQTAAGHVIGPGSLAAADSAAAVLGTEAVVSLMWAAACCVTPSSATDSKRQQLAPSIIHVEQRQQQQQQSPQQPKQQQQQQDSLRVVQQASPVAIDSGRASRAAQSGARWGVTQAVSDSNSNTTSSRDQAQSLRAAVRATARHLLLQMAARAQHDPQQQQQQQQHAVLCDASLRQLSLLLWCTSRLQLQMPQAWWQGCFSQLQELLHQQLSTDTGRDNQQQQLGQSLAMCTWALGRSRELVPHQLRELLQAASLQLLEQAANNRSQDLPQLTYVMLLLGSTYMATSAAYRLQPLSQNTRRQQLRRQRQQQQQHGLQPHAALQGQPGQQQCHPHIVQNSSSCCSSSSSSWSCRPLEAAASTVAAAVSTCASTGLISIQQLPQLAISSQSHSVAEGMQQPEQQPQQQWSQQQQDPCHYWVAAAGPSAVWLRCFCGSALPAVSSMPRHSLVSLLWALGKLRYHPGSAFMSAVLQRVKHLLPVLGPWHIALLLWSMARLQHAPDAQLQAALLGAFERQLAFANKADIQQVAWAQEQLQKWQQGSS